MDDWIQQPVEWDDILVANTNKTNEIGWVEWGLTMYELPCPYFVTILSHEPGMIYYNGYQSLYHYPSLRVMTIWQRMYLVRLIDCIKEPGVGNYRIYYCILTPITKRTEPLAKQAILDEIAVYKRNGVVYP